MAGNEQALESFIAEQEALVESIGAGMLAGQPSERDAYQVTYGAYLLVEAGRIQAGLQTGTPTEAMQRAEQRTYDLMKSLGAHLEEDMSEGFLQD